MSKNEKFVIMLTGFVLGLGAFTFALEPVYPPGNFSWGNKGDWPLYSMVGGIGVVKDKLYMMGGVSGGMDVEGYAEFFRATWEWNPITGKFQKKDDIPMAAMGGPFYVSCKNKDGKDVIFVGGGIAGFEGLTITASDEFFAFDPSQPTGQQWTALKKLPEPVALPVAELGYQGGKPYIYVFGGWKGGEVSGMEALGGVSEKIYAYDIGANKWEDRKAIVTPRRMACRMHTIGNKIYMLGGVDVDALTSSNLNQCYDPETDSWSKKASLPYGCMMPASGIVETANPNGTISEKIVLIGGNTATNLGSASLELLKLQTDKVIAYDPKVDKWYNCNKIDIPIVGGMAAVIKNKIYTIGGFIGLGASMSYSSKDMFVRRILCGNLPPSPVTPLAPAPGAMTRESRPTFEWVYNDPNDDPQCGVEIQFSKTPDFSTIDEWEIRKDCKTPKYTLSEPLAEGVWYWRVRVRDSERAWGSFGLGDESYPELCRKLGIDCTEPQISNLRPTNPYVSPNGDGVKDTTRVIYKLADEVSPPSRFSLKIYKGTDEIASLRVATTTVTALANGVYRDDWDVKVGTVPVSEGKYTYKIEGLKDALGNEAPVISGNIFVDITEPQGLQVTKVCGQSFTGSLTTGNSTPLIEGEIADSIPVEIEIMEGARVIGSGSSGKEGDWNLGTRTWEVTTEELSDGEHTIFVKATDFAGNSVIGDTFTVTIDRIEVVGAEPFDQKTTNLTKKELEQIQFSLELAQGDLAVTDLASHLGITDLTTNSAVSILASEVSYAGGVVILDFSDKSKWGHRYKVTLKSSLANKSGTQMGKDYAWEFSVMAAEAVEEVRVVPNPFNPLRDKTQILYEVSGTKVTILIYNLMGELVKEMDSECDPEEVTNLGAWWDGRNGKGRIVANGGYYCIIKINDKTDFKRYPPRKIAILK